MTVAPRPQGRENVAMPVPILLVPDLGPDREDLAA